MSTGARNFFWNGSRVTLLPGPVNLIDVGTNVASANGSGAGSKGSYLLFPGRHLVNTKFQEAYLRRTLSEPDPGRLTFEMSRPWIEAASNQDL